MIKMEIPENFDFPPFETENLLLRKITNEDLDFIFRHFSNPKVARYLFDEPPITTITGAEEIVQFYADLAGKPFNRWIITEKDKNQPLGTCGFHNWDRRYLRAEIGYDLSPDFWGQGIMNEALRGAIMTGFDQMRLNRIEALVYVENDPSVRLLEKLGFKREGLLRDYFYLDGQFYDHFLFSLLRRDWGEP